MSDGQPGDLWNAAIRCRNISIDVGGAEDPQWTGIGCTGPQSHAIDFISHRDHRGVRCRGIRLQKSKHERYNQLGKIGKVEFVHRSLL